MRNTTHELVQRLNASPELRSALNSVVVAGCGNYAPGVGTPGWLNGERLQEALNVQAGLQLVGYTVDVYGAYGVWDLVSENWQAGWLMGAESVEGALAGILQLCHDVKDGTDRVGISAPRQ